MEMDLRTVSITPLRQTFGHLARRMGADKPASRYMEATMDMQPMKNFHFRPTWDPIHELFDEKRTAIVMKDWYALKDPRQYYYGAWTQARSKMQETAEADFDMVEELGLATNYSESGKQFALDILLPLRHLAWGANLNNTFIAAYGSGAAVSQAGAYASMDQLGIAQYITRLAIAFDEVDALPLAKEAWLADADWQELRRYSEDTMVLKDWFELHIAQNFALDGLLYPMIYEELSNKLNTDYGPVMAMLTRFQREWYSECAKWVDSMLKVAAAENPENKEQLSVWIKHWLARSTLALRPIAVKAFGDEADTILEGLVEHVNARAAKAGITL